MLDATTLSPLHTMVSTTATDFWNDSCSIEELDYAIREDFMLPNPDVR